MTTRTGIIRTDRLRNPGKGAVRRLRASLSGGRRPGRRTATTVRQDPTLLRDVALGGTAATAANRYLQTLATGRRG